MRVIYRKKEAVCLRHEDKWLKHIKVEGVWYWKCLYILANGEQCARMLAPHRHPYQNYQAKGAALKHVRKHIRRVKEGKFP